MRGHAAQRREHAAAARAGTRRAAAGPGALRAPARASRSFFALLVHAAASLVLGLACSGTLILETPEERGPATPLARSPHPRSASLTYRLGQIKRLPDGVRIDLTLQNGSSRDIDQGLLRILLMGPSGQLASARLPFVGLPRGKSRPMAARFPPVEFQIQDLAVELIFAVP